MKAEEWALWCLGVAGLFGLVFLIVTGKYNPPALIACTVLSSIPVFLHKTDQSGSDQ